MKDKINLVVILQDSSIPESLKEREIYSFLPEEMKSLIKLFKFGPNDSGSEFLPRTLDIFKKEITEELVFPVIISSARLYNMYNGLDVAMEINLVSKKLKEDFPSLLYCVSSTFNVQKKDYIDFNFHKEMPGINQKIAENIVEIYNHIIKNHT